MNANKKTDCYHPLAYQTTKVVSSAVTCEVTVTVCSWCGQELGEPKTDCL